MTTASRFSLAAVVMMNVNIIIGSGIFINTVLLAQLSGIYSALTYVLVGILILPLMLSFAQLAQLYKGGSLYTYAAALGPFAGFISTWSYFNTKLASCAVAVHVCTMMLRSALPALALLPELLCDVTILAFFTLCNCFQLKTGKRIQTLFVVGKMLPVMVVLISGIFLFSTERLGVAPSFSFLSIIAGIPFVLYAFMGFEASSSLSRSLHNPGRDGARAIFISFAIGVLVTTLFQCIFSLTIPDLGTLTSFRAAFPALIARWGMTEFVAQSTVVFLHICIALSAAGVAFGILYTNAWNLCELAERGHLSKHLLTMKSHHARAPLLCIVVQAFIVLGYLLVGLRSLPVLQQLAAFGVTCTYLLSVSALWYVKRAQQRSLFIPCLGLTSCLLLLGACIQSAMMVSFKPFFIFLVFLLLGSGIFYTKR